MNFIYLSASVLRHRKVLATVLPSCTALAAPATAETTSFADIVALIVGLAWPLTVLLLVFAYRGTLSRVLAVLEQRIRRDPKVNAFGLSFEAIASAALPPASVSGQGSPATSAAIERTLSLSRGTTVLVALGEISQEHDQSAVIGSGDALGLALVQAALLRVAGIGVTSMVVRKVRDSPSELLQRFSHVVSIGGPRPNRITGLLFGSVYTTFEFRRGGVYDRLDQKLHVAEFTDDGMMGADWAILLIVNNPVSPHGRAVVLAGYSGYGTNAAAAVFARLDKFPQLQREEPLEALIRVRIAHGTAGSPEVVVARTIAAAPAAD